MANASSMNKQGFDAFLTEKFRRSTMVGAAVTITKDDRVVYFKGLGFADKKSKTLITDDTIFQIASVSKLVTGTAVMQLSERGIIDIDADINEYLPFNLVNPHYPKVLITPRMVMTHTSSIQDDYKVYDAYYTTKTGGGDSPVPLAEFLPAYLLDGGKHYDARKVFFADKPGAENKYSNIGYGLLGLMVEFISGQDFSVYCRENIFKPLKMDDTGWRFSEINRKQLTIQYARPLRLFLKALPPYGFPTYPDGCLKTSSADWSRFMMAMKNGGVFDGVRVLEERTIEKMWKPQFTMINDHQGLAWELHSSNSIWKKKGMLTPGHTGGDPGVITLTYIIPENNTSVTVFFNSDMPVPSRMKNIKELLKRILTEAESL